MIAAWLSQPVWIRMARFTYLCTGSLLDPKSIVVASGGFSNRARPSKTRSPTPSPADSHVDPWSTFFFFFTLVTGPRRSLSLKLSDTKVYEPQIQARLGNHNTTILVNRGGFADQATQFKSWFCFLRCGVGAMVKLKGKDLRRRDHQFLSPEPSRFRAKRDQIKWF